MTDVAPTEPKGLAAITITDGALQEIFLHVAKYAVGCAPVMGALIGRSGIPPDRMEISYIAPLFHSHALHPILQDALEQLSLFVEENNVEIVGIYCATPPNLDKGDTSLPSPVASILATIAANVTRTPICLKVANQSFTVEPLVQTGKSGSLVLCEAKFDRPSAEIMENQMRSLIETHKYRSIFDFENHLDDISFNWLPSIPQQVGK